MNEDLKNEEMSWVDLDNFMMENGYFSNVNDDSIENIKGDLNTVYTSKDTLENEVIIEFEIITDEEMSWGDLDNFIMKIKNVDSF